MRERAEGYTSFWDVAFLLLELGSLLDYLPRLVKAVEAFAEGLQLSVSATREHIKPAFTEELKHQLRGLDALSGEWSQYIKEAEPWVSYQSLPIAPSLWRFLRASLAGRLIRAGREVV